MNLFQPKCLAQDLLLRQSPTTTISCKSSGIVKVQGELRDGDCGSWVSDANTGDFFGHIVACNPTHGLAYLVPAAQTFEDLHREFGAEFSLPMVDFDAPLRNRVHYHPQSAEHADSTNQEQNCMVSNSRKSVIATEVACILEANNEPIEPHVNRIKTMEAVDDEGRAALIEAAENGRLAVTRMLLDHEADVSRANDTGQTATIKAAQNGHASVVTLLLDHGADPATVDDYGRTALMEAAHQGCTSVVDILLRRGADPSVADDIGRTALIDAAQNGCTAIVRLLLHFGADISASDNSGRTALLAAAMNGHKAIVSLLVARGADPSAADDAGRTPLIAAAQFGHKIMARFLLNHGVDVSGMKPNSIGVTLCKVRCRWHGLGCILCLAICTTGGSQ